MAFTYSRSLTIDHTKCGASDSTSFPVLASASDATLKDAAHGGHVQDSAGADILFFSDAALATQIASEIDFYDNVNGIVAAWVKVATVSHTADTVIYIAYGNASPPARTTNPWDANFKGVWHLPNGTSLTANDSTNNGINGTLTNGPTAVAGKIDGGANFASASSQSVDLGTGTQYNFADTTFSVECWFKCASPQGGFAGLVANALDSTGGWGFGFSVDIVEIDLKSSTGADIYQFTSTATFADSAWHHAVAVITTSTASNAGNSAILYIDGAAVTGTTTRGAAVYHAPTPHSYLARRNAGSFYNGALDEVRVSNAARSADWILTEYNNQNAPGNIGSAGFLTWGSESALGSQQQFSMLGCGS